MLRHRMSALGASLTAVPALVLSTQSALADDGDTDVGSCNSDWICTGVEVPGNDGKPADGGNGSGKPAGGGGKPTKGCAAGDQYSGDGKHYPCSFGGAKLNESDMCYYGEPGMQPPKSDPVWKGHKDGKIYMRACIGPDGEMFGLEDYEYFWSATDPLAQGPTAAELAQQAASKMRLDGAKIGSAPRAGSKGLIGMPVWMWTAKTANTWGPISTTASAGGLGVTATAKVQNIKWAMGDGTTVTCSTPGTPYQKSFGKKDSPDCGHRYTKVPQGGKYTVTATTTWVIEWQATNGESGTLPNETRQAQTEVAVGELQVVN